MNKTFDIVLRDDAAVSADLLPLTYTRPIAALRVGIETLVEKWQAMLPGKYSYDACHEYLHEKFPLSADVAEPNTVTISAHFVPSSALVEAISSLSPGAKLLSPKGELIAQRGGGLGEEFQFEGDLPAIRRPYDIFLLAEAEVKADFARITAGRKSQILSVSNTVVGDASLVFLEEGAKAECAIFNTTHGPIYIGKNAEVMEGSMLRGPVALCENAEVKMGSMIYGATVIGPWCKVGGELNNVVMQAYSNKAHYGFLGNAVIGEWCNLGAGCVASNLKNNYSEIKLWSYPARRFLPTGLQFCGLIMGDHSKAGINTMFNTATVIGVGVNIHQAGFPRAFVASFSDGGSSTGFTDVALAPFIDTARRVMARRNIELTEADERMFTSIRAAAEQYK